VVYGYVGRYFSSGNIPDERWSRTQPWEKVWKYECGTIKRRGKIRKYLSSAPCTIFRVDYKVKKDVMDGVRNVRGERSNVYIILNWILDGHGQVYRRARVCACVCMCVDWIVTLTYFWNIVRQYVDRISKSITDSKQLSLLENRF